MKLACSFEVQPLSWDTSESTLVYVQMYPCGEVCMAYASSVIPGVKVTSCDVPEYQKYCMSTYRALVMLVLKP